MTLKEIIIEALHDPQNRREDGSVKWNWVDSDLWLETQTLAKHFLFNYKWIIDPTDGATHYHAYYVRPSWAESKLRTARIESHIFYRWKK